MNEFGLQSQVGKSVKPEKNFDVVKRKLIIGGRAAVLFFIDGFIKDEVFEKMLEFFFKITPKELSNIQTAEQFTEKMVPYVEADFTTNADVAATAVLSGPCALFIENIEGAALIDTRQYPTRSVEQPEKDRTMRGARDGFVETLVHNTALIRRRIRLPQLCMEYRQIGSGSKIDVALCYLNGKANQKLLKKLNERLSKINTQSLSMTQQALAELLVPTNFFNPFPKVRFTERPDYAAACVLEGKILLIVDNSPAVMIFPTNFADFTKEANDYYFPPVTGTYIRLVRVLVSVATVYLTPFFLWMVYHAEKVPNFLKFVIPKQSGSLPILAQLLVLELVIDGLRIASLNTPDNLSGSLSIVGGLLLSEFAIDCGWFVPECILYMSFVAIAAFCQPSFEMGYAQKFMRIVLLLLTRFFGLWGLLGGTVLFLIVLIVSNTVDGRNYFAPVFPFYPKEFAKMFVRTKIR